MRAAETPTAHRRPGTSRVPATTPSAPPTIADTAAPVTANARDDASDERSTVQENGEATDQEDKR